ncbi:MAG: PD-(D/E)XK nuclease family protein [Muribaculaceae bacterium]|nr:PD-(D/E)XK nuclease family protein [Muribaculaceae bacterium]
MLTNKTEAIKLYNKLLQEFEALPKVNTYPTFMELCQMGGDRFEERCSQILSFYFNPDAPHKLHGLLIKSLLDAVKIDIPYSLRAVNVHTEEMTPDRKFIDITITGDNFVIAIENKIGADLYNPLDSYVSHIKECYKNKEYKIFIVLSARRIVDTTEIKKMERHGYLYINYSTLFEAIKQNLGHYAIDADHNYLTFLFDFMRTIEKRYNNINMELNKFFFSNRDNIENLISQYDAFKNNVLQVQKEHIGQLKGRICDLTGANWWAWQGWDLGISFNDKGARLGIESSFGDESFDNPLGDFHIYITVWRKKDFYPYEADLKAAYPNCYIDYNPEGGNRVYLHLPRINGSNTEAILKALVDCYNTVKEIAAKHQ